MSHANNKIWAKDNGLSLHEHTNDILKAYENIKNKISGNQIELPIEWAIKLHDIGKVLPYFQIVSLGNSSYEPRDVNKDLNIYHSLASILFIDKEKLKGKLENDEMFLNYVLSAIAYHHWKNSLEEDLRFGGEKFENLLKMANTTQLVENIKAELNDLLKESQNIINLDINMLTGLANGLSFVDYVIPPYQMYWLPKRIEIDEDGKKRWILISGFLQRCDHYASFCEEDPLWLQKDNNKKTDIIKNIEIERVEPNTILQKIKEEVQKKINQQNINLWQETKLNEKEGDKFKFKDNLILIAPTGSGKTEFAFLWSSGEKFFYTLPLRAAVEQIYERAKNIFGDDKTGLLHSDADVYLLGDDYNYERIKVYEVAKQMSYPAIVSTGDQFFPYGLRPPGYERIYATFSYSRLVIDEIQAYDPRAVAIIVKFIEDIVRMGGKFLLMTATLPEYVKNEIKERINENGKKIFNEINLYEEENDKYTELKKHKLEFKIISNRVKENKPDFSIPNNIIHEIIKKAQNQRVLVIINTVKQAQSVYEQIIQEIEKKNQQQQNQNKIRKDNVILFHSQFTLNEKQRIKETIEEKFKNPKDLNDNEGKILVATQVIEAAIDIDADILYTEVCPMDALVQRMGRVLRRHKENFSLLDNSDPNVFVFVFKNGYESGNGRVYERELIEKTLILFNKNLNQEDFWDNYYDNFRQENEKLKRNTDIIPFSIILMSEYNKFILVSKLYENINPSGKYLSQFYETLSILDAGFMSDRKEEAQRIFRELMSISVIDQSRIEKFKNKLSIFLMNDDINYTKFKKDIIAEFVISIPYYSFTGMNRINVSEYIINVYASNTENKNIHKIKKIARWCDDIFFVNLTKNYNIKQKKDKEENQSYKENII